MYYGIPFLLKDTCEFGQVVESAYLLKQPLQKECAYVELKSCMCRYVLLFCIRAINLYKYVFTVYRMFYRGSAGICRNGEQASRQSSKNKEGSSWDSAAQDGTSSRILHL